MTKLASALTFFVLLFSPVSLPAQDSYWLGEARGPYATGTHVDMWIDESRDELTTEDPNDKRRVMVQFWYPATTSTDDEPAPYILDPSLFQDFIQEWSAERPGLITRSVQDASPHDDGPFPVLLYSHGGNAALFSGTAQTEFLASQGYVVVSVAHTDDSAVVHFPDGTDYSPVPKQQMPTEEERVGWTQLQIYEWQKINLSHFHEWYVEDLSFALNVLEGWNQSPDNKLYRQLDLTRVGALGWSRGGATSFQATVDDQRVKAAANLDGTIYGRSIETMGTDKPLLLLESTDSYYDPLNDKEADPELEELWSSVEKDLWGMFRRSTGDWYRAKIIGTQHAQFFDFPLAEEAPPDYIAPQKVRDINNALLLEFFDKYFKGRTDTPLLDGQDLYPELRVVRKKVE